MLFRKTDLRAGAVIKSKAETDEEGELQAQGGSTRAEGELLDSIRGVSLVQLRLKVGEINPGDIIPFATGGQWSSHEMLEHILLRTGPADVWLTTWSLTEEPIRALVNMHQQGFIRSLTALFDYRIKERNPKVFALANSIISRMKLTKIHAKVTVVINEQWTVTVISSANFTKNPRIEAGVILTCPKTAQFNLDWIESEIANEQPLKFKKNAK